MTNMSVAYQRPNRSLLTLRDEVHATYGYTPARASEFVTGYKAPTNFTGHNADSNGIVHAVDIFTDENGNLPEDAGRELAERLRLIGKATNRFSYLIHDMCPTPGVAWPRIAGQFNGWVWQEYGGVSPHTDHIHVSTCDMYWGDPAPIPASVYDSTKPWGLAAGTAPINPAGGTTTPVPEPKEWDEMATEAQIKEIAAKEPWRLSGARPGAPLVTMWERVVSTNEGVARLEIGQRALSAALSELAAAKGLDGAALVSSIDAAVAAEVAKVGAEVRAALQDGTVNVDVTVNGQDAA